MGQTECLNGMANRSPVNLLAIGETIASAMQSVLT
jgi:hypothetical protein